MNVQIQDSSADKEKHIHFQTARNFWCEVIVHSLMNSLKILTKVNMNSQIRLIKVVVYGRTWVRVRSTYVRICSKLMPFFSGLTFSKLYTSLNHSCYCSSLTCMSLFCTRFFLLSVMTQRVWEDRLRSCKEYRKRQKRRGM